MTIEKLQQLLDSIPNNSVINRARRLAIIAQIYALMDKQERTR